MQKNYCYVSISLLPYRHPSSTSTRLHYHHSVKKTRAAIESGDVANTMHRLAFVRECVAYYEPILPYPTAEQYMAITQALLKAVPCVRDRSTI